MRHLNEIQIVVSITLFLHPTQLRFYPCCHLEDYHLSCSTSERRLALYVCSKYSSTCLDQDPPVKKTMRQHNFLE